MMTDIDLEDIIQNGKLKTYDTNKSFIEIYWCHSSLKEGQYYLFLFTTSKDELMSVQIITPRFLPVRYKPKIYAPKMEALVKELIK